MKDGIENMLKKRAVVAQALSILGLGLTLSGCNVCEDLDAKVCADLGEADCAYWKSKELNFTKTATQGRQKLIKSLVFGDGAETCRAIGSDAAYGPMLEGTKQSIAAQRKADEAIAKAGAAQAK